MTLHYDRHKGDTDESFVSQFHVTEYEGWNFNSGNYLFTTDTK